MRLEPIGHSQRAIPAARCNAGRARGLGGGLPFLLTFVQAVNLAVSTFADSTQPAGCVSEAGTGGACVDGTALDGATGVTLSPDGSTVYVASETSRAVAVFSRNPATGAISQLTGTDGCVSSSGTGGACAVGIAIVAPRSLALSPDGETLYYPATSSAAIAVFSRDQTTGALAQLAGLDASARRARAVRAPTASRSTARARRP